jgi:hypothetical protein
MTEALSATLSKYRKSKNLYKFCHGRPRLKTAKIIHKCSEVISLQFSLINNFYGLILLICFEGEPKVC